MRDWSKPKVEVKRDWSKPRVGKARNWAESTEQPGKMSSAAKPFPGKGFALGLGQWAEDTFKGLASHGAEPEIDIPTSWRPEKLQKRPQTNRSPSFNLAQYV